MSDEEHGGKTSFLTDIYMAISMSPYGNGGNNNLCTVPHNDDIISIINCNIFTLQYIHAHRQHTPGCPNSIGRQCRRVETTYA